MTRTRRILLVALAVATLVAGPATSAQAAVVLDGSLFKLITAHDPSAGICSPGVNECGVIELAGLGPADYQYVYGPTFEPNGTQGCFTIDGTFTIILRSDGSSLSGPLNGTYCTPGRAAFRSGGHSYGNPFSEDDVVAFGAGTGQFAGLGGPVRFAQSVAGAVYHGALTGTLTG